MSAFTSHKSISLKDLRWPPTKTAMDLPETKSERRPLEEGEVTMEGNVEIKALCCSIKDFRHI